MRTYDNFDENENHFLKVVISEYPISDLHTYIHIYQ